MRNAREAAANGVTLPHGRLKPTCPALTQPKPLVRLEMAAKRTGGLANGNARRSPRHFADSRKAKLARRRCRPYNLVHDRQGRDDRCRSVAPRPWPRAV
jgi:hypothetical protein